MAGVARSQMKLRVIFQPSEKLFDTLELKIDLWLDVQRTRDGLHEFYARRMLATLLNELSRQGKLRGLATPTTVESLLVEHQLLRCMATTGTPIQRFDVEPTNLNGATFSLRNGEQLRIVRNIRSVCVHALLAQPPVPFVWHSCWNNEQLTHATMRQLFRTTRVRYLANDYSLCLLSTDDLGDTVDWIGFGMQQNASPACSSCWIQRNQKLMNLARLKNPVAASQVKWCWFDELYGNLYELDTRIWRAVALRKRYFRIVNSAYLAPLDDTAALAAINVDTLDQKSDFDGTENDRGRTLMNYDLLSDLVECRQTMLLLLRTCCSDEKSFETGVRRLIANIGNESVDLDVSLATMELHRINSLPTLYNKKTTIFEQKLLQQMFNDNAAAKPTKRSMKYHAPVSVLDKHTRLLNLVGAMQRLLSIGAQVVYIDEASTVRPRGHVTIQLTNEFVKFIRHLFDVRLSRFRLIGPVRLEKLMFLPICICTGRILFMRIESMSRAAGYHVKLNFERSMMTRALSLENESPRNRSIINSSIVVKLDDCICWCRDIVNQTRERSIDRLRFTSKRSQSKFFRYFSLHPNSVIKTSIERCKAVNAYSTMILRDPSTTSVQLHGRGVRDLALLLFAPLTATATTDIALNELDESSLTITFPPPMTLFTHRTVDEKQDMTNRTTNLFEEVTATQRDLAEVLSTIAAATTETNERTATLDDDDRTIASRPDNPTDLSTETTTTTSINQSIVQTTNPQRIASSPLPNLDYETQWQRYWQKSLFVSDNEDNCRTTATTTTTTPPTTTTVSTIVKKLIANFHDLYYVDKLLTYDTGERLFLFQRLEQEYRSAGLLIDDDNEDDDADCSIVERETVIRLVDLLQQIYARLPALMNHLLRMQRYELHRKILGLFN